jgi:hypothetical protein
MAAPNIANLSIITGKTAVVNVSTSSANLVTNSAGSNKVFKINSVIVSNIDGTNPADISASLLRSSVDYRLASTITVPSDATLVIVSRDMQLYLEEGDSISIIGSANGDLQAICSYEEVS